MLHEGSQPQASSSRHCSETREPRATHFPGARCAWRSFGRSSAPAGNKASGTRAANCCGHREGLGARPRRARTGRLTPASTARSGQQQDAGRVRGWQQPSAERRGERARRAGPGGSTARGRGGRGARGSALRVAGQAHLVPAAAERRRLLGRRRRHNRLLRLTGNLGAAGGPGGAREQPGHLASRPAGRGCAPAGQGRGAGHPDLRAPSLSVRAL